MANSDRPDGESGNNTQDAIAEENDQRVLLKDKAYSEIKQRILDGEYSPGSFLAERRLAQQLEMSKTPIRSAIERLEAEGFVSVSPRQGIVVKEAAFHEIVDFFDIRIALETFVVRRLAGTLSSGEIERIQENLEAQRKHAEARTAQHVAAYVDLDAKFHLLLCEFFGNQEIVRSMTRQRDKVHRIVSKVLHQNLDRMPTSTEEHVEIAEAVIKGEKDQAAELMKDHLEYGKQYLIER